MTEEQGIGVVARGAAISQAPALPDAIESDPIAKSWEPRVRERYRAFAHVLGDGTGLSLTVGRGGLSFYANPAARRTFVCHFNAVPRAGRDDLGFADFQPGALEPQLDPGEVVADLERRLSPDVQLRKGKAWCGAHFSREQDAYVAHAFRHGIVEALLATR